MKDMNLSYISKKDSILSKVSIFPSNVFKIYSKNINMALNIRNLCFFDEQQQCLFANIENLNISICFKVTQAVEKVSLVFECL